MSIGVVGFGAMGGGIAQACSTSGLAVTVVDIDEAALSRGRAEVQRFTAAGVERGKLTEEERGAVLERIRSSTRVEDLADVDLVIEAAPESLDAKRKVYASVTEVVDEATVIATNTSAIGVTELAYHVHRPDRFIGLHFFNPAAIMPLVEVVRALQSSDDAVATGYRFAEQIGKKPVTVDDRPGFLVNSLLMPYLNHAIRELDNDLGRADEIDEAIRLGLGHPMGPYELLDLIGLDTHLHATESAYEQTGDPYLAPPALLRRMVAADWLGSKSGRGLRSMDAEVEQNDDT